jgi:hypothetical protein
MLMDRIRVDILKRLAHPMRPVQLSKTNLGS